MYRVFPRKLATQETICKKEGGAVKRIGDAAVTAEAKREG